MRGMIAIGLLFIRICLPASLARADDLHLRLPAAPDGKQRYYYDLLSDVMRTAGHPVSIELVSDIPQIRFPTALESGDIDAHPDQEVERTLLLTNDMDVIFYVSRKRPDLAALLTEALQQAATDGVISRHAQANWAGNIQALDLAHRVVIGLQKPPQANPSNSTP